MTVNQKTKWRIVVVTLLVLFAMGFYWRSRQAPKQPASGNESQVASPGEPSGASTTSANSAQSSFLSAASDLAAARTPEEKGRALARLREALKSGNTNEMVLAIRRVLDTRTDAPTGQGFKVGGGGTLLEAPTLRTLLLDQLAALDPTAAAAHAREIFASSDSPDEWAVALRNLARGDTSADARAILETKTGELLRNEAWQRDPSVGYLEAFDTALHLGGTKLLPPLADLVRKKDKQAVAHAAFLTLDRLVINQPVEILAALNEHPDWMTGREETRANYFARADLGDAAQRRLVESYLLDAARSPAELQTFAGVFPNANFMISHNLLTGNATLDGATLRSRDQAALAVVTQWMADPRFENYRQTLSRIQERLKEFAKSAR